MPETLSTFDGPSHTRARGTEAELAAVRWLARNGYRVLERNYRSKLGEIDVIARDGDTLCFLEIKARSAPSFGPAVAAVGPQKQAKIARAATAYLAFSGWEGPCRFDVLGIDRRGGSWSFTLIEDAFQTP